MNYQRIMVFASHADDEITMAPAIARAASEGVRVVVVQMTDGCEGYPRPEMRDEIVALRVAEAEECNKVLGVARRVMIGSPDMGLTNDKETLQRCIRVIREERPQAIFTHGADDRHRDHRNTHAISVEARWHAGVPVAAILGPSWTTPYLYYYKAVGEHLPQIRYDVSGWAHKRLEAQATQVSQYTLWHRTKESFEADVQRVKEAGEPAFQTFWIAEANVWTTLPSGE
jgi:LmbE family N-acetylglucosaminyl deacetylase